MAESIMDSGQATGLKGLLLDPKADRYGPVTRSLLVRTGAMLGIMFALGLGLVFASGDPVMRAVGLSMIFPGGGFLYASWPSLLLLTLLSMAFAFLLWWALSAFVFVPLVWILSIVASALVVDSAVTWEWAVPAVLAASVALLATALVRSWSAHRRKLASVPELNEYLATAEPPEALATPFEPNELDRELLGWMYQLALQPADQFEGYDWGEQYHGGTCLRYQLAFLGESLAAYAANQLPNHQQVVEPALASFILRMTDQRVWKYWQVENFLARGDLNPDPISNDNVMLTGFYQSQISLYEAATGCRRFDEPGGLKFVWKDGRVFSFDHQSISEAIVDNLERSNLGLYSCEPTWVFTFCNTQAAQGLLGYDRIHGTSYWARVKERFRAGLEQEMMTADGAFRHIRTNVFGFSFNDGDGTGEYYTSGSHGFEDIAPDLSRRGRILSLRGVDERMAALEDKIDHDGYLDIPVATTKERATYIPSALSGWFGIMAAAQAVGNERVFEAASRSMERECGTGARFPQKPLQAGVQTIAMMLFTRWGRPLSLGQLNLRGYQAPQGPILSHAPWPDVIVTRAVSDDGVRLDLIVEPYQKTGSCRLEFTELRANTRYRLSGNGVQQMCVADGQGMASVELPVEQRVDLSLAPAND